VPTPARLHSLGLRALARRELTSGQLRDRLVAAGGRDRDIADVLARLREEGALDDRRAARVYAQTAFRQRKRTRARIQQELSRLGIPDALARDVLDEVCGADIERHRLEAAVIHGLRGTRRDHRAAAVRNLVASLVRQGYALDDIRRALARAGIDADADEQT
jgi:SOS response regulatory protein OraA/RecX